MITIALPKGRLAEETLEYFESRSILSKIPNWDPKELVVIDSKNQIKLLMVRSQDVPTYVEECAADCGVVGWDVLMEGGFDLLTLVDLGIGRCRLSLAAPKEFILQSKLSKLKVATKYPELARSYFNQKGVSCEIIKLYGSIELAPLVGLADCIVDLVSTGATLAANGLVEHDVILESSARLVWNRNSFYMKGNKATWFLRQLEK